MADRLVRWTDAARLDLEQIVQFVAKDSPSNALAVLERIEHRSQALHSMPQRGRIVPELRTAGVQTYRELVEGFHGSTPPATGEMPALSYASPVGEAPPAEGSWRIVYRYDDRHVYVIAVLDARRDLSSLLLERLAR